VANVASRLPHLVAADMDGTFLTSSKQVPVRNMALLDELAAHGGIFVPCTGRPVSAVPDEVLRHGATRFAIGANGAVVYDVAAGRALHVEEMNKRDVIALYERVRNLEATFDVFADGEVYSERARYDAMCSYGIDEPTLKMLRRVRKPVDALVPAIVEHVSRVEKITCFWRHEEDRAALDEAIREAAAFSSAHGHPKNFELQAKGVSKGTALRWLCDYVGIDVGDVVAFGDEANDLPLLLAAGDGVAMANATDEVRAVADHVTSSNDDAGVAAYFRL
jgi:Cof subfamily protein (haloacid dehalogenase superfamily)